MNKIWLCILACGLAAITAGTAAAQRRGPPGFIGPVPPLEAAGCYFYRGRQYCGRYCYIEVNGRRYCQRFERDAHPQADVPIPEPGLK